MTSVWIAIPILQGAVGAEMPGDLVTFLPIVCQDRTAPVSLAVILGGIAVGGPAHAEYPRARGPASPLAR